MHMVLQNFVTSKKHLLNYFACKDDYPIRVLYENKWIVKESEGMYFLTYWTNDDEKLDFAISKKDGEPIIYEAKDLVMIIAIDCIKTAFIFNNNKVM